LRPKSNRRADSRVHFDSWEIVEKQVAQFTLSLFTWSARDQLARSSGINGWSASKRMGIAENPPE
jgi:hypothetical protein